MKKLNIIFAIMLISLVSAGVISLSNAKFTPEIYSEVVRQNGTITFDCGKTPMSIYLDEPNMDIDDDFEYAVGKICHEEITNVIDWTNRTYKENVKGIRSFEVDKLIISEEVINQTEEISNVKKSFSVILYYCEDENSFSECPGGLSGGKATRCYDLDKKGWDYCSTGWINGISN